MPITKSCNKVGYKQAISWSEMDVPDKVLRIEDFTKPSGIFEFFDNSAEAGTCGIRDDSSPLNLEAQTASFTGKMRYKGFDPFLFAATGLYTFANVSGSVNKHEYVFADDFSSVIDKAITTMTYEEHTQTKSFNFLPNEVTIDQDFMITGSGIARAISVTGFSFAGATRPDSSILRFRDTAIYIADHDAGAMTVNDKVNVNAMSLVFRNGVTAQPVESSAYAASRPEVSSEPREIEVSLTFTRKTDANFDFQAEHASNTLKQIEIIVTGALIEGGLYEQFKVYIPAAYIMSADYSSDDNLPVTVVFKTQQYAGTHMAYSVPHIFVQTDEGELTQY